MLFPRFDFRHSVRSLLHFQATVHSVHGLHGLQSLQQQSSADCMSGLLWAEVGRTRIKASCTFSRSDAAAVTVVIVLHWDAENITANVQCNVGDSNAPDLATSIDLTFRSSVWLRGRVSAKYWEGFGLSRAIVRCKHGIPSLDLRDAIMFFRIFSGG